MYVAYVNDSDDEIVIKYHDMDERPTEWTVLDRISVTTPSSTYPSIAAIYEDRSYYLFVTWTEGDAIMYSIYKDGSIMTGTRIQSGGTTTNVSFEEIALESVYRSTYTPKFPTTLRNILSVADSYVFAVSWTERPSGVLRYNSLTLDLSSATPEVDEEDPVFVSNTIPIRDNTAPSMEHFYGKPKIVYETNSRTSYPTPSTGSTWPRIIAGRSFYQISSGFSGYSVPWYPSYYRVVSKSGNDDCVNTTSWPYVVVGYNFPNRNGDNHAPSMSATKGTTYIDDTYIGMNFDLSANQYIMASYNTFTQNWPASATLTLIADGKYPHLFKNNSGGHRPLSVCTANDVETAGSSGFLDNNNILYEIKSSATGFNKTAGIVTTDELREWTFVKNDSALVIYGVASPHYIQNDTIYTALSWDVSYDSLPYQWWNSIPRGIRTESFTVPADGEFEFGNELFGSNVTDFAPAFPIAIEFRDATEDTVCYYEIIDMAAYTLDSSVYVLDRVDISSIAGKSVYMCINHLDSSITCDFTLSHIFTPYYSEVSKKPKDTPILEDIPVELGQNFPNPFNPTTRIPFELKQNAAVRIKVFNSLGVLVATLKDGMVRTGQHVINFDAEHLPSGLYICTVEALGHTVTRKMHLVK